MDKQDIIYKPNVSLLKIATKLADPNISNYSSFINKAS